MVDKEVTQKVHKIKGKDIGDCRKQVNIRTCLKISMIVM